MRAHRSLLLVLGVALLLSIPRARRAPAAAGPEDQEAKALIIVTTAAIKQRSRQLGAFIAAKQARGFKVLVGTEAQYGGAGLTGLPRALKIRSWLQQVHRGYRFLLLIGDAHPLYGEVPMLRVWPRHTYAADECGGFALDCRKLETDAFYADLTGDWDKNGNGRYGEHTLDEGTGGLDLEAELIVGRIPANLNQVGALDRILRRTLSYSNQTAAQAVYRKRMLLPAAFYYFRGQQMTTYSHLADVDGADVPRWYIHNHLKKMKGVRYTRLYEQAGLVPSSHATDLPLTREALLGEWKRGYGMVFWFAHGLPDRVSRVVWRADDNGNGRADAEELDSPTMLQAGDMARLPGDRPGFVVASSCEVGSVENMVSLTQSMLEHGAAVGVIASTSVTPGGKRDWEDLSSEIEPELYGSDTLGVSVFNGLIAGKRAASVLAAARVKLGTGGSVEALAGKLMLNYYGDPTLTLYDTVEDVLPDDAGEQAGAGGCGL